VFAPLPGYARTIVLAPAGAAARFASLETVADVVYVGGTTDVQLDLPRAFEALRERGIASMLCEGGPTLAGRLLAAGLVRRVDWLVAPSLLAGPTAVPVLTSGPGETTLTFERVERLGPDVVLSAVVGSP
jgi:riboflavin biosynthesis pyrimidine reductase